MPTIVATLKVKQDKLEAAKTFFKQLAADVLANEPGALDYRPLQASDDPTKFVFIERYADEAAFAAHAEAQAHVGPKFAELTEGGWEVVKLEEI